MNDSTILIIEDDDLQYEIYEDALAKYQLIRATSGSEALARIPQHPPDVVVLDHVLAEGELGLDYLPELKDLLPFVPIIIVSGALEVHQQIESLQGPRLPLDGVLICYAAFALTYMVARVRKHPTENTFLSPGEKGRE